MYFDQLLSAGHTRKVAEKFFLVISTIFLKKIKNYPTIAGAFLNNAIIKDRIPKQVFKGIEMCRTNGINLVVNNEITIPNCTKTIDGALYGLNGTQSNTLCSGFFAKTLSWGVWTIFFPLVPVATLLVSNL